VRKTTKVGGIFGILFIGSIFYGIIKGIGLLRELGESTDIEF